MAKATNETRVVFSTDADKIGKMVDSVLRRAKSIVKDIHTALVSTTVHAIVHGDTTLMMKLVDGIPGGFRKQSILKWLEVKGPMTYVKADPKAEDKAKRKGRLEYDKAKGISLMAEYEADKDSFVKTMLGTTFADFDPEPEYQGFDLAQAAHALLRKAEGIAKGENADHPKTNLTGLDAVRTFISNTFKAKNTKKAEAA